MRIIPVLLGVILLFGSCNEQEIIGIPPEAFVLKQNVPNPFSDTTFIEYGIPSVGSSPPRIRISVYDRYLDPVTVLRDSANHPAGNFAVTWRPSSAASAGLYYIELQQIELFGSVTVLKRIAAIKR